ncbi:MAG: hypothetical protein KDC05_11745 [Bacteroidales bacterium]|nr:hypothetical protein [Bacteroidales bacterium]
MEKLLFSEEQRYKPIKVRIAFPLAMAAVIIIMVLGISMQFKQGVVNPEENEEIIFLLIAMPVLLIFITVIMLIKFRTRLITRIDEKGIHIQFPPRRSKAITFSKETIGNFYVRQYRPKFEFGGHGYKFRGKLLLRKKFGIAYTAHGTTGIQLELSDNRKVLIGTQREQAFMYALEKLLRQQKTG